MGAVSHLPNRIIYRILYALQKGHNGDDGVSLLNVYIRSYVADEHGAQWNEILAYIGNRGCHERRVTTMEQLELG